MIEELVIIDYPARFVEKQITEEGRKILQEYQEWMSDFMKDNDIHFVKENGDRII
jgi:hypothetical protein